MDEPVPWNLGSNAKSPISATPVSGFSNYPGVFQRYLT